MPGIISTPRTGVLLPANPTRDWSILTFSCSNTAPGCTIGDIAFATSAAGANVATGGTPRQRRTTNNATNTFSTDTNLFDGSSASGRSAQSDDLMQAAYELPSALVLREVRITAQNDALASRGPLGFAVMLSEDGRVTWQPAAVFSTTNNWTASETRAFVFDPGVWVGGIGRFAARAWRLLINGFGGSNPRIGDLIFAGAPGGATLCVGGAAITNASGFTQNPNNAFDGNTATYWNGVGVGVLGQRIGYVFPGIVNVKQMRLQAPSGSTTQMPTDFEVQWSSDLLNWTTALTVSDYAGWASNETRSWTIP